ncbi:MAG: sulfatase-like hydrolase/transferase, partial [Pseudomonadota bacterium]|nr:sulfatase-like hydrolase/transferase [Pseudomonadota bacterium]
MSLTCASSLMAADQELTPEEMEKIAKMTANPLGAAWMLWLQNDYFTVEGDLLSDDKLVNSTKFQPVMSFPLKVGGQDWNLIVLPVIQYQSAPLDRKAGKLFGNSMGDIAANPGLGEIAESPFGRTTWEGGFRVPLVVRWPGVIKPGTKNNDIISQEDWMPTLMAAA